jgi:hypothetical protein
LLPQRRLSPTADKGYLAAMPEMGQQETPALQKTNSGETLRLSPIAETEIAQSRAPAREDKNMLAGGATRC